MKRVITALIFFILATAPAFSETPEAISKSYFDLLKTQQWDKISALYDIESLHEFR